MRSVQAGAFVGLFVGLFGVFLVGLLSVSSPVQASEGARGHSGFSGLPYFVPRHSRLTLYKYRAVANKEGVSAHDQESLHTYEDAFSRGVILPGSAVSDCSVNIGNIFSDGSTCNFGNKENVVIIDGDVVNAGDCR